jgi:6-phosphogluconolactonase (cycloisomerase 2 family)
MYVLGEDSDTLERWRVDAATGLPEPTGYAVGCASPVCMVFWTGPSN